ncbi:transforming growth factor beta receptor type 3-like isoform X1 [Diadema antillarum]|uniref:transforming growth factor beta receptor type 3-like isoform X1 n=1 Tax=Diadema antillarum TaxID=105358 RepID=UPI003A8B296A
MNAIIITVIIFVSHVSAATKQQTCDKETSYISPFVEAFYSHDSMMTGCTRRVESSSHEIHVINLHSSYQDLLHTGHDITLHIGPRAGYGARMRMTMVVLNSLHPVEWHIVTDRLGPLPFQFLIPANSSVIQPASMVVQQVTEEDMPVEDQLLLEWVETQHSKVWTFTSIESANVIRLQVGDDPSAPEECILAPNFRQPHVSASQVEAQQIGFCTFDSSQARYEVHVVWLLSARAKTSKQRSNVEVNLKASSRRSAARREVVIILQAAAAVPWNVVSEADIGHLTIMSPHDVNTDGVTFPRYSIVRENIPATGDSLLRWAQEKYGAVVSFTEAILVNRFDITIGKANISRQQPLQDEDQPVYAPIDGPHVLVECLDQGIRALVPTNVAEHYNLSPEDVTLEDRACTSVDYQDLGFMLHTQLDECGTTAEQRQNKMIYHNRVLFFSGSPGVRESESGMEPENGSGMIPSDDEADASDPFAAWAVECTLPYNHGSRNQLDPTDTHVTLHLDMFETPVYQKKVVDFPAPLEDHSRLYFQVGVSGGQQRYDVVINQCWIQVAGVILRHLIDFSCPVDKTLIFHEINPNYVSLDPHAEGNVKRFSFEVFWTQETFSMPTMVSCKLSLCANEYSATDDEKGIPVCSYLEDQQQACSGNPGVRVGQPPTTGPSKTVEVGPLQDSTVSVPAANQDIDNAVAIEDPDCDRGDHVRTVSGLGAGSAAAIAFAAFTMGVLLTACLWFIHTHTGPKSEIPGSPRTLSTPSSPMVNGHIPNGHLPNGVAMMPRRPPDPAANGLHMHLANGMNPNQIPARGLMNAPIGESV